jgi:protein arginine kinase activator
MSPYQKPKIPLSDILEGLLKQEIKIKPTGSAAPPALRCANCGLPFESYRRNLLLGCSECYPSFREFLIPDLRRFHGDTRHYGRRPGGGQSPMPEREPAGLDLELELADAVPKEAPAPQIEESSEDTEGRIEDLTRTMHKAIADEDYPRAAHCRDQIRELKEKIKKHSGG